MCISKIGKVTSTSSNGRYFWKVFRKDFLCNITSLFSRNFNYVIYKKGLNKAKCIENLIFDSIQWKSFMIGFSCFKTLKEAQKFERVINLILKSTTEIQKVFIPTNIPIQHAVEKIKDLHYPIYNMFTTVIIDYKYLSIPCVIVPELIIGKEK